MKKKYKVITASGIATATALAFLLISPRCGKEDFYVETKEQAIAQESIIPENESSSYLPYTIPSFNTSFGMKSGIEKKVSEIPFILLNSRNSKDDASYLDYTMFNNPSRHDQEEVLFDTNSLSVPLEEEQSSYEKANSLEQSPKKKDQISLPNHLTPGEDMSLLSKKEYDNQKPTSKQVPPVPEPSTLILFGSALPALGYLKKKFFK